MECRVTHSASLLSIGAHRAPRSLLWASAHSLYLWRCKQQTAFVIPSERLQVSSVFESVCVCVCTCLYLHWSLLCKNELHWSGSLLSLAMVSKVTSTCLNCGRSYKCMKAHGTKVCLERCGRILPYRRSYLRVGLPTLLHQLCKTCWTAGGDGQPLETQQREEQRR